MHSICRLILTLGLAMFLCAAARAADTPAPNFLPNPSFEQDSKGQPHGWKTAKWAGEPAFEFATGGRTGKRSLLVSSEKGADAAWTATASVEPWSTYRLSGWIKTEDVKAAGGRGALLNLHDIQGVATQAVTGTNDWTKVEVAFETKDIGSVEVNCLLGGWGMATGKAWFDDLALEQTGQTTPPPPRISIDAAKTGEPLSKYVYGQFIEHLGRCIYGGIWAEMLEDRKFWFPITPNYAPYGKAPKEIPFPVVASSPWQIIGSDDGVKMAKEDPFVGQHTPLIAPGSGIRQNDLGLVKGKQYVGYIWVKPAGGEAKVEVALRWGGGDKDLDRAGVVAATNRYEKCPIRFTAGADTTAGNLEIRVTGGGPCFVGTVSLMPADNVDGMRADTLALLRQLGSPVYRWPGGNFVSGYNWRDGIGDRDRRPPRKNPAWTGVEHNDFGLHEFMRFCDLIGTEAYIAVNSGLGDTTSAVEEVQYANGAADTPMGKLRAANGRAEPFKVKWWSIGNEMYGGWQLGHMPLEKYTQKHNEFAGAMRAVDPSIKLIAVGDAGPWSEGMMKNCADYMDLISEHFYCQERPGLMSHVAQISGAIRRKADAHRKYRRDFDSLKGKDIRIAMDEWNYWYGSHPFGELGTRYFLKDALGIAAGIHEYARQSDIVFMANYAQTVNVIGCIKTSKTAASFETTGLALKMYRERFGTIPAATETTPLIDAQAAWTADKKTLTVGVVNPSMRTLEIPLGLKGAKLTGAGTRWQIAGADPMAFNDPASPATVAIEESPVKGVSDKLSVPPCSATIFALSVE
jgi:alpha-N-arabinofuranosidase